MARTALITTPHARCLLGLQAAPAEFLRRLLALSRDAASPGPGVPGAIVANLFFEDSTRTRTSFSVAARRLGAEVVDLLGGVSSVSKGETLIDTARNVEAMGVAALVVRARQAGSSAMIARAVRIPVINAGDGRHEHPTQGLLDTLTLAQAFGREGDFDLAGLRVAIVGDVASSRVARSAIAAMTTLGADVTVVGPPALAPRSFESLGAHVSHTLDDVLPRMDAVMMLRIQFERHAGGTPPPAGVPPKSAAIASVREYRAFYALTPERAERMKKRAIVMHPGPINRGIELDEAVADGPRSVILRQVSNGVLVRMGVLRWCLGEA
ncbi:MAG: aspartate carbamoyltransferase catalytic subunit [Planctomycetota bacterium]|nr:aspartate carbamoyltransferase catalytic subunit [Planctomycetota bacterium]